MELKEMARELNEKVVPIIFFRKQVFIFKHTLIGRIGK